MCQKNDNVSKCFWLACLFATIIFSTSVFAKAPDGSRGNSTEMMLNSTLRASGAGDHTSRCFETTIHFPGILWLDVSVPGPARVEPRLDVFLQNSDEPRKGGQDFFYIERYITGMVLEVRTQGSYLFCVTAQDPSLQLGDFKLMNTFEVDSGQRSGDPDEDDPDPDSLSGPHSPLEAGCRSGEMDDHGNTFACATAFEPGHALDGEIWNGWGDDEDYFSFLLTELQTVAITTAGKANTLGSLFDRSGHRLATDDDGGRGTNFRIVKTLGPGWYFVRIEGFHRDEGTYRLFVDALNGP